MRAVLGGLLLVVCLASAGTGHAGTFTVTTTAPNGAGSLGAALAAAEAVTGPHTIAFDIPGTPPHVIATTAAAFITKQVTIDATTQPGYAGVPLIVIDGASNPGNIFVFTGGSTPGSAVKGFAFRNIQSNPIFIESTTNIAIESNYFGLEADGTTAAPGSSSAIFVSDATAVRIGGASATQRNIISAHSIGVDVQGTCNGLTIRNNYIGTDVTGTVDLGNNVGIRILNSPGYLIDGNIISGNSTGVFLHSGGSGYVQRNYIGLNASGTAALGNGTGISIGTPNVYIGGPNGTLAEGNVISGNTGSAIHIEGNAANARIHGNYIGTNPAGTAAIPNQNGIVLNTGANGAYIGMTNGRGNVISGNTQIGLSIARTTVAYVYGNLVGTNAAGTAALGNGNDGIVVYEATGIEIGAPDGPNTVAYNGNNGITLMQGSTAEITYTAIYGNSSRGISGDSTSPAAAVVTSAEDLGTTTRVRGTLTGVASREHLVQLFTSPACDGSGFGEGQVPFPGFPVTTDASGAGAFNLVLSADAADQVVTATVIDTITANTSTFSACRRVCPQLAVTPAPLPSGTPGVAYSQALTPAGGTGPYTVTLASGTLPDGITLTGATLSGTPTTRGSRQFTLRLTDAMGCTSDQTFTLDIACGPITIAPSPLPAGEIGVAYDQTLTASGGLAPFTFNISGMVPPWLTVSSGGAMSGTPAQPGAWTFTVFVSDSASCSSTPSATIEVEDNLGGDGGVGPDAGPGRPDAGGAGAGDGGGGCCGAADGQGPATALLAALVTILLALRGAARARRRRLFA